MEGYVKLFRCLAEWQWHRKPEMVTMLMHMLVYARHADGSINGTDVKRGELLTTLPSLSEITGLSIQTVRTCINRLISTGEITVKVTNKFRIITICNYVNYQGDLNNNQQTNQQPKEQTTNRQNEERKEPKEIREQECIEVIETPSLSKDNSGSNKKRRSKKSIQQKVFQEDLETRQKKFVEELRPFISKYKHDMVLDFYNFWAEPDAETGTIMKKEMQETWCTSMRLSRWSRKNKYKQN